MAVKNNLKLIFSSFALNVKKEWQYKTSFFMQIILMIFNNLFFVIQWLVIFKLVDNIGGYGFNETMLLWAIYSGGYGVAHLFFGGAWNLKDFVYTGKLDVFLTQPKSVLINSCCSSTDISAIGDIIYSFLVLIIIGSPWYWFLIMVPVIILAGILHISVYVTFCSFCFYIKRGDAVAHSAEQMLTKTAKYPPAIFNMPVKWLLSFIVPAFFYTVIPAKFFFATPNAWWIVGTIAFISLWVVLAFVSFKKGLKHYNSGNLMIGRL